MNPITEKALQLFDYALDQKLASTKTELCNRIGLVPTNLAAIKKGERTFTHEQLYELARLTKANMNWVYGFSTKMFRSSEKSGNPLERIKQAVEELESKIKKRK